MRRVDYESGAIRTTIGRRARRACRKNKVTILAQANGPHLFRPYICPMTRNGTFFFFLRFNNGALRDSLGDGAKLGIGESTNALMIVLGCYGGTLILTGDEVTPC